jgi:hypothetical protein
METKHTKGNWEATPMGNVIHKETGKMICATQSAFKEDNYNAKLIADSPLMFEYIMRKAKGGCKEAIEIIKRHE